MGLDLYMLPVDGDLPPKLFFAHNILSIDRNAIIGDIRDVAKKHAVKIPQPVSCFIGTGKDGESKYGQATEDPYGDPLAFVLAKHLKPLAWKVGVPDAEMVEDGYKSRKNRAAFAYVTALPDDYKIVLYWH